MTVLKNGFSLMEVVAAMTILALTATGIVHIINRSIDNAINLDLKMQALEVARENMENLLSLNNVQESTDYGTSEIYPKIDWTTTIESFYEPITDGMWVQAICNAEYTDTTGEIQSVELTHWITSLTRNQIMQLMKEKQKEQEYEYKKDQLIDTIEQAVEYAGVDEDTIIAWVENGMPVTIEGYFIKPYLDIYNRTNGQPTEKQIQDADIEAKPPKDTDSPDKQDQPNENDDNNIDMGKTYCGKPMAEIMEMDFETLVKFIDSCPEFNL